MTTFASLFTGFGGADEGAKAAGLRPLWGIEHEPSIAAVARDNGHNVMTADVLEIDPSTLERSDVLHASPPCTRASNANPNAGETQLDIDLAQKIIQFIDTMQPKVFILENVYPYRHFESWKKIEDYLNTAGYWLDPAHVNSADYGVPQTRKRMIVRAVYQGFVPHLPPPVRWVGWYEAIEDLIPELPTGKLAQWQIKRLPEWLRALLMSNAKTEWSDGSREPADPAFSVTPQHNGRLRAVLVGSGNTNMSETDCKPGRGVSRYDEPSNSIAPNSDRWKAVLIDGKLSNSGADLQILSPDEPARTVVSSQSAMKDARDCFPGRVVCMTPRALARFQSFPDSYRLPNDKTLACKGIGNAVPPKQQQRMLEDLLFYIGVHE